MRIVFLSLFCADLRAVCSICFIIAFLTAGTSFAGATDPIVAAQAALKQQQLYEGETHGHLDAATRAAVKRFQIRQGIEVTGELDAKTAAALQNANPAEKADAGTTLPARERARGVVQSDREFLEKIEALGAAESALGVPSGATPAPQSKSAPLSPLAPPPTQPEISRKSVSQPSVSRAPAPRRAATETNLPPPVAERTTAVTSDSESEESIQRFLESYLDAAQEGSPDAELEFYADEVDYFDSGKVGRRFIEKDQRSYYQRWPARKFTLVGSPTVQRGSENAATVRYRLRYSLRGGKRTASGETDNVLRVKRTDAGWKIAAVRERKIQD